MANLSKSKYCSVWTCPKKAWLTMHKPELKTENSGAEKRMETGNEIGDLAMRIFGDFVEVTAYTNDRLDIAAMIDKTRKEMEKGTEVICEASFSVDNLYCAVDILKKCDDGWEIYEVKSSSWHEDKKIKDIYLADIAYQKYVLTKCGVNVKSVNLIQINGDYVFDGTMDIKKLFHISNVDDLIINETEKLSHIIEIANTVLDNPAEPDTNLCINCREPYDCDFWEYCTADITRPTVFDLYGYTKTKGFKLYEEGIASFEDLKNYTGISSEVAKRQIEYYFEDKGTYIDKEKIKDFLNTITYPLYFLDFESEQPALPKYPNSRPYAQIVFQYSLHYIEKEGGELKHKEFLGISGEDPRRAIAESLVKDIPMNVCVTAYNKAFECTRIKELAELFPDLSEHLLNIENNIVDLLTPFQSGYYYKKEMGGSFSIKSVLPSIYPNDPSLDYHNLEDIHNGGEAMTIFPMIKDMAPDDQKRVRKNLLKYCELDTYAMVKVWEELVRVVQ